uniref:NADH-ubiquinone oxidoreductase chain 6 n=1 Tax=Curculionidae sp. BMNH 1274272 TaxID=1796500 RepID=A0A126TF43_9CUCU|nr:NADH dehydrogenase subunit 6 [Curculionidae sp. BMNH 1274272]
MYMYMYMYNWIFSMIFMSLNHPLSLGCMLLFQTILIALISGSLYHSFWFSYILFLIMIGGMLVMFIYMTSIASNEKFKMPNKILYLFITIILLLMMFLSFWDSFYSNLSMKLNYTDSFFYNSNYNLNKFFNYPNYQSMIILMIYLLITLIAIEKIIKKNLGTLRQN